ncbi:MAG TPA: TlpA disulfide reductase family protein [Steroidobacteraceae bacterium]|nr:TlpA disulfide reductase family protein [Steroidobacteraceae bacterium]
MTGPLRSALGVLAIVSAGVLGYHVYRSTHRPAPPAAVEAPPAPAASQPPAESTAPTIPTMRPVFSLEDRDGKMRSITEWDGKSLVINFWATWCKPCRREIPFLRKLNAARAAQNIEVLGIAIDFRENVLDYIKKVEIDYALLIGEQDGLDAAAAFGLGGMGIPFTVFTDNKGRIVTAYLGELHQAQADLILDAVVEVNTGTLSLDDAKARIASGLKALGPPTPSA